MIPRFRAWDKEFKEMVQVDALVFDEQIIKATYKNGNVVKEDLKNMSSITTNGARDWTMKLTASHSNIGPRASLDVRRQRSEKLFIQPMH